MKLSPGTRVGSFEILAPLGAGGMREVYRVCDTRLRRNVALKFLPDADVLNALGFRIRPYELEPGATDAALEEAREQATRARIAEANGRATDYPMPVFAGTAANGVMAL